MNQDTINRSPQEQEVFRRVWQRVMAGRTEENSPIEPVSMPVPMPPPSPVRSLPVDMLSGDLPEAGLEELTHGETTGRLRQQTLEALEAWQLYRHLARRTRGNTARMLTALATDQHRLARKLATAYFLHSGVRYWPVEQLPIPAIPSLWGALRQRHMEEQQAELSYRMAADEADDPALIELYEELTEAGRVHCRRLRSLLEQSCP